MSWGGGRWRGRGEKIAMGGGEEGRGGSAKGMGSGHRFSPPLSPSSPLSPSPSPSCCCRWEIVLALCVCVCHQVCRKAAGGPEAALAPRIHTARRPRGALHPCGHRGCGGNLSAAAAAMCNAPNVVFLESPFPSPSLCAVSSFAPSPPPCPSKCVIQVVLCCTTIIIVNVSLGICS